MHDHRDGLVRAQAVQVDEREERLGADERGESELEPGERGRDWAAAIPGSRFVPIPGAGHFPHIEHADATLRAIGDFVDTVPKPDEA